MSRLDPSVLYHHKRTSDFPQWNYTNDGFLNIRYRDVIRHRPNSTLRSKSATAYVKVTALTPADKTHPPAAVLALSSPRHSIRRRGAPGRRG